MFDGSVYSLIFKKNVSVDENYLLSLRMGISLEASGNPNTNDSKLRKEMEEFNQRVNSRLFEIVPGRPKNFCSVTNEFQPSLF
ncbi:MAG: hypothetical protein CM1200mP28_16360 [Deltaproteobacteria bacterium]|nr:MAG: hypothetical protein CM1200mP28_16360 [Deltaproteobacteria bacterium]